MYPLKLDSVLKDIIWGGTRLSEQFNKGNIGQKIAEAWVLSCRNDGENVILNGEFSGKPLSDIYPDKDNFPLLIKLIDASDKLSVQVHPDDTFARQEGLAAGKTEMWYVIDAKPGAKLVYGIKDEQKIADDDIRTAAQNGTLENYLNYVEVKKGDVFFIPAGLVHAIGEGILIAEVQQNSNTTYRMYDYNRCGADGKPRELHIDKAIKVMNRKASQLINAETRIVSKENEKYTRICSCSYFNVYILDLKDASHEFKETKNINYILCLDGEGKITHNGYDYTFKKGDSYLLPEEIKSFSVSSSDCKIMHVTL